MKWRPIYKGKKRVSFMQKTQQAILTMAAVAWGSSDVSSNIRIISLKEESAGTAGRALKEELIRNSIFNCKII
jgi:hypothetical protein